MDGVSYFSLLKLVPYQWEECQTRANRILFLWTYWLEFIDFIPIFPIMVHYSIVAFLPSNEEIIRTDVSFWSYYTLSILWVFFSSLLKFSAKERVENERIRQSCLCNVIPSPNKWMFWKAFLCVLQFFNFSYIRAKPFKFLVGGFTPLSGILTFWGLHFICMGNAYYIRRNSIDTFI